MSDTTFGVLLFSDIPVSFEGKKFTIKPSRSGNMSEVQDICKESGLRLFEPRDEATYTAVYEVAKEEARLDQIWLNVKRETSRDP